ncbi:MAG: retropepsin-like domain-containing protein [Nitrospinae bacterium]|nr:retropepsin-like domain-containing protein [Nitrospinota bacterium]
MIRGYFGGPIGRLRPFVLAHLTLPAFGLAGPVHFLVDTGADSTLLAPRDALTFGVDLSRLSPDTPSTGVGGRTPTVSTAAQLILEVHPFTIPLRILAPTGRRQQHLLSTIPSLLGRDILSHFALFVEQRTQRVLLLEPQEAETLHLP